MEVPVLRLGLDALDAGPAAEGCVEDEGEEAGAKKETSSNMLRCVERLKMRLNACILVSTG